MTLIPGLEQELMRTLDRAQTPVLGSKVSRRRWPVLPLVGALVLGGASLATAAVIVLPDAGPDRTPTLAVSSELQANFKVLREGEQSAVPADAAAQLGAGGGSVGKNVLLARTIETTAGAGWVVPAADGTLCLVAPGRPKDGVSFGMGCSDRAEALARGVSVAFEQGDGSALRVVVVPDGKHVYKVDAGHRVETSTRLGAASVETKASERLQVEN